MQAQYLTPGPSELYFTVQDHIRKALNQSIASISHRSQLFKDIYKESDSNLRHLLSIPDDFAIVYCSSATEIWERIMQNFNPSLSNFFVNGAFSEKFQNCAEQMNFKTKTFTPENYIWNWGDYDSGDQSEMIAIAQNETSIGMSTPQEEISAMKIKYPDKNLFVDMVSGLPFYKADWENWDSVYFSVQKGFGLPSGLGVWIVRRSMVKVEKGISPHRQLSQMIAMADKYQTQETPNVLAIYLLAKICGDMLNRGIEMIRNETEYKSVLTYNAIEKSPYLKVFIPEKRYQSKTTIVAECVDVKPQKIIDYLMKYNIIVGTGYGKYADKHIRIANFPTHSKEVFEMMVDRLEEFQG